MFRHLRVISLARPRFRSSSCFQQQKSLSSSKPLIFNDGKVIRGHQIEFDTSHQIATLAETTIVGSSGETIALVTVAVDKGADYSDYNDDREKTGEIHSDDHLNKLLGDSIKKVCEHQGSTMVPLNVEYRQRYHAVGKIPQSANRKDNQRQTDHEILSSRAIDRSLRPLIQLNEDETTSLSSIHLQCSIQSYPIKKRHNKSAVGFDGGHPLSLVINSASLAMNSRLTELVAAVVLCLTNDGTILVDPSIATIQANKDIVGELLYTGTKNSVVMMEFSGMLSESQILDLIRFAQKCIQPVLKEQEIKLNLMNITEKKKKENEQFDYQSDAELKRQLGLDNGEVSNVSSASLAATEATEASEKLDIKKIQTEAKEFYEVAKDMIKARLNNAPLRLFGAQPDDAHATHSTDNLRGKKKWNVSIHSEANDGVLLGKKVRGRREKLINEEINTILCRHYRALHHDKSIIKILGDTIHSQLLREAFTTSSIYYNSRSDGRAGGDIIRPISIIVPLFSDVVHGSALFTRGQTQVLCTTTLGPPRDGILHDPYISSTYAPDNASIGNGMPNLPVGSLRYLKSQEHLESDLNTRKIRADREQTGESGTLRDRRRAFLQYDFPAYCKGEVPRSPNSSRREIGHGFLAEKSILPVLPFASDFPYAIRMTSEVTSSNGSSSMATVCGVTLSLLDAGVPIVAPVAGVSVGMVQDSRDDSSYRLLLDITGTEDFHGIMDFKVSGTKNRVTAFQLDVKKTLSFSVIEEALDLAKIGRNQIIKEMKAQSNISSKGDILDLSPRPQPKATAPRTSVIRFDATRKKDLIGPGGVVIRQMEDRFNVSLDLTQEGEEWYSRCYNLNPLFSS